MFIHIKDLHYLLTGYPEGAIAFDARVFADNTEFAHAGSSGLGEATSIEPTDPALLALAEEYALSLDTVLTVVDGKPRRIPTTLAMLVDSMVQNIVKGREAAKQPTGNAEQKQLQEARERAEADFAFRSECPYPKGSDLAREWQEGTEDAREKYGYAVVGEPEGDDAYYFVTHHIRPAEYDYSVQGAGTVAINLCRTDAHVLANMINESASIIARGEMALSGNPED